MNDVIIATVMTALPILFFGAKAMRDSRRSKRRVVALASFAQQRGLTFDAGTDANVPEQLKQFAAVDRLMSPVLENRMAGASEGLPIHIFDLRVGNVHGHHRFKLGKTIVEITSPKLNLPVFRAEPENVLHKVQERLGAQDIDFDSHPKFSDTYLLRGESEEQIRRTFTPAVLEWFERHPGLTVEGRAERMIVYRSGKLLDPEQIAVNLSFARELCDLFT